MSKSFRELLQAIMVEEFSYAPEEAARLVKKHTQIVLQGIMAGGNFRELRPTVMAIELAETEVP